MIFILGHDLLQKLQQYNEASMHGDDAVTTLDNLEAQKQVKRTLQYIENRLDKLQNFLEDQDRSLHMNVLRDDVQKEFRQVCCTNWRVYVDMIQFSPFSLVPL